MPAFRTIVARLLLCCICLMAAGAARPETRIYLDQVAPLAYGDNGACKGLLCELMAEMARRADRRVLMTPLPLIRLRVSLSNDKDGLGTLWRVPALEGDYKWWFKLLDARFYMVAAADSKHDISSVAAAKHLRVGVILGSPAELMARNAGFDNIQVSTSPESIAKKLALGRIDVWIGTPRVLHAVYQRLGQVKPPVRVGHEVASIGLYLASAHDFSPQEAARWQAALEAMKKDGSYTAILMKYPDSLP